MNSERLQPLVRAPRFEPDAWAVLPAFAPYRALLASLATQASWPAVADYRALLGADVDFVVLAGRLPAGLDASDVDGSYIGSCIAGRVPTREGHLHDLMNALTWARFSKAKMALCVRQVQVAMARGSTTNRLRTRAQDHLAMIDEGGVITCSTDDDVGVGVDGVIRFGHGLLEDAACGRTSRGLSIVVSAVDDEAIAAHLASVDLDTLRR